MKISKILFFLVFLIGINAILKAQTTLGTITTSSGSCNFSTTNVCGGDIIELQPTDLVGFTNFKWYFGSVAPANEITGVSVPFYVTAKTGATIRVSAAGGVTAVYIVTAEYTSPAGCAANNDVITVTFNTAPVLAITNPAATCSPSTVDLTAAAVTAGSTGGGTLTYWTDAGATSALASPAAVTTSGTYYIKATTGAGCSHIQPVTVTVNTTPVLAITNPAATCSPSTADLTATAVTAGSTGGGTLTYWTDAGATSALASPAAVTASGTYYIKATTGAGCSDIEAVMVTVNTTPVLAITNPTAVCSQSTVDLTAAAVTAGSTGGGTLTYWTNAGATSALASPSAVTTSGTYYIKATTGAGCSHIQPVTVTVNALPDFTLTHPTICPGDADYVTITGLVNVVAATGSLKIDGGTASSPIPSSITGASVGAHTATVINAAGCETSKGFTINPTVAKVCIPMTITKIN